MTSKNNSLLLLLCLKIAHYWICYQSPTREFVDVENFSLQLLLLTPTGCFADVVETFSLTTTINFINISPPLSAKMRDNLLQIISKLPPSGVTVFHWCTLPFNCTRVPSSFLQLAVICASEFDCKTFTILWLWMTIPRDQSMNNWSVI